MGSFNATCVISGLPIQVGDKVRYLLLTGSRRHRDGNDHVCYVGGRWQLRGPAFRARYNDYGSIESIEESLATRVAFESLDLDAVQKGVGDNTCHDVEVRPGMDRAAWLEALWEGRVYVRDSQPITDDGSTQFEEPAGVPTIDRVQAALMAAGFPKSISYGDGGYHVDEIRRGFVRVRQAKFLSGAQAKAALKKVTKALKPWANMVMMGTGDYSDAAEILVAPHPSKEFSGLQHRKDELTKESPRPVSQVMVREDVWQILLNTKMEHWNSSKPLSFQDFQAAAQEAKARELEKRAKLKARAPNTLLNQLEATADFMSDVHYTNLFYSSLGGGEGVSGFSLKQALDLGLNSYQTEEELDAFLADMTETGYVQWVYANLHGQWHPSTNSGQDPNWKAHHDFLDSLLAITDAAIQDDMEDNEDDAEELTCDP